ncbi:MAG: DUF5685 family protein [Eubacteriales bacterium]
MFGYILTYADQLSPEQFQRYRSCYCGLCHAMGRECGQVSRLSLNFDMTFLTMLLNAMEEPDEMAETGRCIVHPWKPHQFWHSRVTQYCALLNVALTYYKCLDDWQDDRNAGKLALSKWFAPSWNVLQTQYPRQATAIAENLEQLSDLEQNKVYDIDQTANLFGNLMGELFVLDNTDFFAPQLRQLGQGLGRFIYLLDAICDLAEDEKKGRYNPLMGWENRSQNPGHYEDFLNLYLGEATCAFEQLPLVLDVEILRNILYQGVWTKFHVAQEKYNKREGGKPCE